MASIPVIGNVVDGNIVQNYPWTVSKQKLALEEIPIIKMVEYQQTTSSLVQQIAFWANQAAGVIEGQDDPDPYEGLYVADPTGQSFEFPFLENYHHTVSNNWGSNKGPIGEVVENVIVPAAKVFKPNAGIEPPKAWEGSSPVSYTFQFQLLNTTEEGAYKKNKKLVDRLILANLQNRLNSVASEPPVFYSIDIPGVRFAPVAVISNLTIQNEGQLNKIGRDSIPDSYRLIFNIQELISESRQIFKRQTKVDSVIIKTDDPRVVTPEDAAANIGEILGTASVPEQEE